MAVANLVRVPDMKSEKYYIEEFTKKLHRFVKRNNLTCTISFLDSNTILFDFRVRTEKLKKWQRRVACVATLELSDIYYRGNTWQECLDYITSSVRYQLAQRSKP